MIDHQQVLLVAGAGAAGPVETAVEQQAAIGYVTQPLRAYESNPIWTVDPKHTPYRDAMKVMQPNSYDGPAGYASAGAMADFIVVNMIAAIVFLPALCRWLLRPFEKVNWAPPKS